MLEKFTDNEAKNYIEYLTFTKENGSLKYTLKLYFRAWKEKHRIFTELRIGQKDDGVIMEGKARELLKAVYLKPLRDAEREMSSGRNSRISQILMSHSVFSDRDGHRLKEILSNANNDIEKYFVEEDGKVILQTIRNTLSVLNSQDMSDEAKLETSDIQLKAILESLSLSAPEIHPGLGELNLLFIAAELLLLKHDETGGLKLALIEELEAHLHPQAQLRFLEFLSEKTVVQSAYLFLLLQKVKESSDAVKEKEKKYSVGTVKGFIAPRWTLEYCLAMSCLSERFHRAIYYGKKIKNSDTYSLTIKKIEKADKEAEKEYKQWSLMSREERAFKIYQVMLDNNDKSGLKAIVAQSLASLLKWDISSIPDGISKEQMFDLDLYQCLVDEKKREALKEEIINDKYIEYLVKAIRYAVGKTG